MSDEGDNNYDTYLYRGEADEEIPEYVDRIIVQEDVTVVLRHAFHGHSYIVEVICHDKVEKIELHAFAWCPRLRRVIMPGVKIVEEEVFYGCCALTDVECDNLELIEDAAFAECESLRSINLLSTRFVKRSAFEECKALVDAKFGNKLERIERESFKNCFSLERITIPSKDKMISGDNRIFMGCDNLKHVDLVEGALHETIAALQLEDWRNDVKEEIDSINEILPITPAGSSAESNYYSIRGLDDDYGEKAMTIRRWIRSVLRKIIDLKAEHRRLVGEEVATTLQLALPREIVMNNILCFIALPFYTFEVEDYEDEESVFSQDSIFGEGA